MVVVLTKAWDHRGQHRESNSNTIRAVLNDNSNKWLLRKSRINRDQKASVIFSGALFCILQIIIRGLRI